MTTTDGGGRVDDGKGWEEKYDCENGKGEIFFIGMERKWERERDTCSEMKLMDWERERWKRGSNFKIRERDETMDWSWRDGRVWGREKAEYREKKALEITR
jgi:hypothetical protein